MRDDPNKVLKQIRRMEDLLSRLGFLRVDSGQTIVDSGSPKSTLVLPGVDSGFPEVDSDYVNLSNMILGRIYIEF